MSGRPRRAGCSAGRSSARTRARAARRPPAARARPPSRPTPSSCRSPRPARAGGNVLTITASELGTSSAPAMPCSARAPTRKTMLGASAQSSEVAPNAATPSAKIRALAEQVAERAPDQDQRPERQQVAVDDPLLCGEPAAERHLDRRQGDVHDGAVEQHDARPDDAGDQRQSLDRGVRACRRDLGRQRSTPSIGSPIANCSPSPCSDSNGACAVSRMGQPRTSSAAVRIVAASPEISIVVTTDSRQASSSCLIFSREPISAICSMSARGTLPAASSFLPAR